MGKLSFANLYKIIQIMFQIKQIVLNRIKDILELQQFIKEKADGHLTPKNNQNIKRYNMLMKHRKVEDFRNFRQSQLLANLSLYNLNQKKILNQVFSAIFEIIIAYDYSFSKYKEGQNQTKNLKDKLRAMMEEFFKKHNYRQKLKMLNFSFRKDFFLISASLLMGWISEWSKKIYYETLYQQIKVEKKLQEKQKQKTKVSVSCGGQIKIKNTPNSYINLKTQKKQQNPEKSERGLISSTTNVHIPPSYQNQYAVLVHKANVYSYLVDDLQSYYKLTGMNELDHGYLRNIKKKSTKYTILQKENMIKAVQILTQSFQNKKIQSIIKEYERQFYCKFQRKPISQKKEIQSQPKRRRVSPSETKQTQRKITHKKSITEAAIKINVKVSTVDSNLISDLPKLSQLREKKQFVQKLEKVKVLKAKKLIKLPQVSLTKSLDKEYTLNNKKIIYFPTNLQDSSNQHINYAPNLRNSQKNIGAKQLYANRKPRNEKSLRKLLVEDSNTQRYNDEELQIQENERPYNIYNYNEKGSINRGDLYTIRQKSRALLKNYQVLKKYK